MDYPGWALLPGPNVWMRWRHDSGAEVQRHGSAGFLWKLATATDFDPFWKDTLQEAVCAALDAGWKPPKGWKP